MVRILILQDEPSWNDSLKRCLQGHHELVVIHSSSGALKALHSEKFDAIISRVHLKDDDVFQFVQDLKSDPALAHIPVICFCGLRSRVANIANSALDKVSRSLGANAFLSLEDFCVGEDCDFDSMRSAIEAAIKGTGAG